VHRSGRDNVDLRGGRGAILVPTATIAEPNSYAQFGQAAAIVARGENKDGGQLVKAVFENQPRLLKVQSAASDSVPQNADKNTVLPFHPGAVRYYREIAVNIPDSLVPTN
jgi:TRAP-type uncharacterized transport system substrate-binding protein